VDSPVDADDTGPRVVPVRQRFRLEHSRATLLRRPRVVGIEGDTDVAFAPTPGTLHRHDPAASGFTCHAMARAAHLAGIPTNHSTDRVDATWRRSDLRHRLATDNAAGRQRSASPQTDRLAGRSSDSGDGLNLVKAAA
jgi:hypothetical protein